MSLFHAHPQEGAHLGEAKTHARLREHFYWPGMALTIRRHVLECRDCQLAKKEKGRKAGWLKPILMRQVRAQLSVDLLDAMETTPNGNRYIIVMTDACSGYLMAIPVKNKTSEEATRAIRHWTAAFRYPHVLITDNGTNFVKGNLPRLLREHAVHLKTSTPYRAQGNGRAERAVQIVRQLITANSIDNDKPWDEIVWDVVDAYNASKHASTGFSPHFLMFGDLPELACRGENGAIQLFEAELGPTPEEKAELLEWFRKIARGNIAKAQARQKAYFDKHRLVRRFEPGATVKLLKTQPQLAKQSKFKTPYIGPLAGFKSHVYAVTRVF
jgi:transposase InsO family protein